MAGRFGPQNRSAETAGVSLVWEVSDQRTAAAAVIGNKIEGGVSGF